MKTENLLWLLFWSLMMAVMLVGLHIQRDERDDARLHAQVDASTVPPSTNNVSTR